MEKPMSMVNRVAAAIHFCPDDADAASMALAAITAMREATFDMLLAGQGVVNLSDVPGTYENLSRDEIGEIWDAMIDAAIKEQEGEKG